ncbi:GIY-YIG nuclease family protein [Apilactobacillus timberlakei]|uniref:GIY-YIG nuclease family protein n=1 Tax=Apilactobacillus timberlakei TaxID=2008380 RepID=A0ABY2YVM5_9LACO|nr:GIY-YIG nuclease family protein [Apilactobacillus timberlakei]TPR14892.1 GIY-YIG nuclease family protein [Apilactobacillus timberlakei]TPR15862.1 GIY-YIG nuclease family protein [Apilactobacillus timberlakei]TPR16223.1 GIY-YIG nuclease family protein [Apilactobacillus timberlakei]
MRSKDIYTFLSNEDDYYSFKYAGYNNGGSIIVYYVPRDEVNSVLDKHAELKYSGVYLLMNVDEKHSINEETNIYVGQAKNINKRTYEHNVDKEAWWNLAILFIKNNDISFTQDEILYLERYMYQLINKKGVVTLYSDHQPSGTSKISLRDQENFKNDFADLDTLLRILSLPIFHIKKTKVENKQIDHSSNELSDISQTVFHMNGRDSDARAIMQKEFKVLKGSKLSPKDFSSSFTAANLKNYQSLVDAGIIKDDVFQTDYTFNSPSTAAKMIYKSSANGNKLWHDKKGKMLKEYLNK